MSGVAIACEDLCSSPIQGSPPEPFSRKNTARLHDLLVSCFKSSFASMLQLSVLIKGARGSGKTAMLLRLADELGYNVVKVRS